MQSQHNLEADIQAIQALNQHDINASMAMDVDAIVSQWTDDFVTLSSAAIVRGRSVNASSAKVSMEQMKGFKPLEYNLDAEEITVAGDYAFEWGTYRGSALAPSGETVKYVGKFMRILQRQQDGSWKMHRTMATTDPQQP